MLFSFRHCARRAWNLAKEGEIVEVAVARARSWNAARRFNAQQSRGEGCTREYSAALPEGLAARKLTLRLSVPRLPPSPLFSFSEHVTGNSGEPADTVLATGRGGFAISRDLGRTWEYVAVPPFRSYHFANIRSLGDGEYLAQARRPGFEGSKTEPLDLFVLNEAGEVLSHHPRHSFHWHGCRAVDMADGTLMYAENPSNEQVEGRRPVSPRVLRSRDRGRSWEAAFERRGDQIRHFHFLQARPGVSGEWWLSSGDLRHECRIWVSQDDGDSWRDLTEALPDHSKSGSTPFNRSIFRLTDLHWMGDEVLWATDDYLGSARPPGACVFRSKTGPALAPQFVGRGKWHFRNIVDLGEYFLLLSQRSNLPNPPPEDRKPGVYLLPKKTPPGAPGLVRLFDLDTYPSRAKAGFTFSKASRAAKDGTFFSFRSSEDVFPAGHKILRWDVSFA